MSVSIEQSTKEPNTMNEAHHCEILELLEQREKPSRGKHKFCTKDQETVCLGLFSSDNGNQKIMTGIPSRF